MIALTANNLLIATLAAVIFGLPVFAGVAQCRRSHKLSDYYDLTANFKSSPAEKMDCLFETLIQDLYCRS